MKKNVAQHVVIILGVEEGPDIENLAEGRSPDLWSTRFSTMVLAIPWLVLLIACTGIKAKTWYLLAVVMISNDPEDGGGPRAEVFAETKVMLSYN